MIVSEKGKPLEKISLIKSVDFEHVSTPAIVVVIRVSTNKRRCIQKGVSFPSDLYNDLLFISPAASGAGS